MWPIALTQDAELFRLTSSQWSEIATIVVVTGATATLIDYYYGLKRIPASHSSIYELAWPLSAFIIGVAIFQNSLTQSQLVGAIGLTLSMSILRKVSAQTS